MFFDDKERLVTEEYLSQGYIIKKVSDYKYLDYIDNFFLKIISKGNPDISKYLEVNYIFNNLHLFVPMEKLNDLE